MKNMRNLLATVTLMAILMIGASTAKAGIIMNDGLKNDAPKPCTETKTDSGVLVTGFTGVLVTGAVDNTPVDCGILIVD